MSEFDILYAIQNLHNGILDNIMIFLTNLGDKGILWIAIAVILIFIKKTRKCGILMLVSMGLGLLIGNGLIKNMVQRARPCWIDPNIILLIPNLKDYSFPSGHTLASFEASVMIFLHNKKWGTLALIFSTLIAFSRLYLFVHFPTDVLGGAILGTLISLIVYYTYEIIIKKKIEERKKNKNEKFSNINKENSTSTTNNNLVHICNTANNDKNDMQ